MFVYVAICVDEELQWRITVIKINNIELMQSVHTSRGSVESYVLDRPAQNR
jgi:hypothetical protein